MPQKLLVEEDDEGTTTVRQRLKDLEKVPADLEREVAEITVVVSVVLLSAIFLRRRK